MGAWVPMETRGFGSPRARITGGWFRVAQRVLGTEPRSSQRRASTPDCRVIFPTLLLMKCEVCEAHACVTPGTPWTTRSSTDPEFYAKPLLLTFPKLPFPSTMRKLKSVSFTLSRLLDGCFLSSEGLMTLLPAGPSLAF